MQRVQRNIFAIIITTAIAWLLVAPASAEELSLQQVMKIAIEQGKDMQASRLEVDASREDTKSMRGHFLPVVTAEANVIIWDDESTAAFDMSFLTDVLTELMSVLPPDAQARLAASMSGGGSDMLLREQVTYGASVTVAQPLSQLYQIYYGYKAKDELHQVAKQQHISARHKLEMDIAKTYLGLLTAQRMVETSEAALAQVEEYERQVQAFLDVDRVERNALMKVQVQKAEIQQGMFAARKGVRLAKAMLNLFMNRPLESPITPIEDDLNLSMAESLLDISLTGQRNLAMKHRPEIKAAQHGAVAANAGKHAAIGDMLPQVSAMFKYDYKGGMGSMQKENEYYGGVMLSWNVWEWGATYYKLTAAQKRERKAEIQASGARDQIMLDVTAKRLELEEALESLKAAVVKDDQARENLRLEKARYEADQTTTADLLTAQTLALSAENDLTVKQLAVLQNSIALKLAMGRDALDEKGN
jgi:OMF family outer membrane factor